MEKRTILMCPACAGRLAQLGERAPGQAGWRPYVDPVDQVAIYRCHEHGRFYVAPGGAPTKTDPMLEAARGS